MNVGDLFEELSAGELRNLYMGSEGTGEIKAADRNRVIFFANRALSRLFSRVVGRRMFLELRQVDGRRSYPIRAVHAVSDETELNTAPRFLIDDVEDPFTDRLIKIIAVRTIPTDPDVCDENVLLNSTGTASARLTSFDTILFPEGVADAGYMLELQMDHPKLSVPALVTEQIAIPPMLSEALQIKIAAGIYGSMNGTENLNKSVLLESQFEALVRTMVDEDLLQSTSADDGDRLHANGFV